MQHLPQVGSARTQPTSICRARVQFGSALLQMLPRCCSVAAAAATAQPPRIKPIWAAQSEPVERRLCKRFHRRLHRHRHRHSQRIHSSPCCGQCIWPKSTWSKRKREEKKRRVKSAKTVCKVNSKSSSKAKAKAKAASKAKSKRSIKEAKATP